MHARLLLHRRGIRDVVVSFGKDLDHPRAEISPHWLQTHAHCTRRHFLQAVMKVCHASGQLVAGNGWPELILWIRCGALLE